jgi:hypothetical protein
MNFQDLIKNKTLPELPDIKTPFSHRDLITDEEWEAMSDSECVEAIRNGHAHWFQISKELESESEELRQCSREKLEELERFVLNLGIVSEPEVTSQTKRRNRTTKPSLLGMNNEEITQTGLDVIAMACQLKSLIEMRAVGDEFKELIERVKSVDSNIEVSELKPKNYDCLVALKEAAPQADQVIQSMFDALHSNYQFIDIYLDTIRNQIKDRINATIAKQKTAKLPYQLAQQTCQEIKTTAMSIAHATTLKYWSQIPDEKAYQFIFEDVPIKIKLSAGENLRRANKTIGYEQLESVLRTLGTGAAFLFEILISILRDKQHIAIELDTLIKIMGWNPKSVCEREENRRQIFQWLRVFSNLTAHGKRKGNYKDPITKEVLDLNIQSKLLMLSEVQYEVSNKITINQDLALQEQIDEEPTPVAITLTAGPWLVRFRKNDGVLQYIGNILMLAKLPTGQARGEWALSIGMTLNQLWREGAQSAQIGRTGDSKQPTIIYKRQFTRDQLLNMFPPIRFAVEEILNSDRPKRAQE